jgi:hypothetical protein
MLHMLGVAHRKIEQVARTIAIQIVMPAASTSSVVDHSKGSQTSDITA